MTDFHRIPLIHLKIRKKMKSCWSVSWEIPFLAIETIIMISSVKTNLDITDCIPKTVKNCQSILNETTI